MGAQPEPTPIDIQQDCSVKTKNIEVDNNNDGASLHKASNHNRSGDGIRDISSIAEKPDGKISPSSSSAYDDTTSETECKDRQATEKLIENLNDKGKGSDSPKVKKWKQRIQTRRTSRSTEGDANQQTTGEPLDNVKSAEISNRNEATQRGSKSFSKLQQRPPIPTLDVTPRKLKKKRGVSLKGKKWHERLDRRRSSRTLLLDAETIANKNDCQSEGSSDAGHANAYSERVPSTTQSGEERARETKTIRNKEIRELVVAKSEQVDDQTTQDNVGITKVDDAFEDQLKTSFLAFDALLDNVGVTMATTKDDEIVEPSNHLTSHSFDQSFLRDEILVVGKNCHSEEDMLTPSFRCSAGYLHQNSIRPVSELRGLSSRFPLSSDHSTITQSSRDSQTCDMSISATSKQRIVELLRKDIWSQDIKAVQVALRELGEEAGSGPGNRANIVRCGGVLAIIRSMDTNPAHESLHIAACDALAKLALNNDAQTVICEVGGVSTVVRSMREHTDNDELQSAACVALESISRPRSSQQNSSSTTFATVQEDDDAVESLLAAMTKYADHQKIQAKSFGALANLCIRNPDRLIDFSKSGGIIAMTKALHQPWENIHEQYEAISSLSVLLRNLVDHQTPNDEEEEDRSTKFSPVADDSLLVSLSSESTNKTKQRKRVALKVTSRIEPPQKTVGNEEKGECTIQ